MSDDNNKDNASFGRMGGLRVILYALLAILVITSLAMRGNELPEWEKCKESLVQQFFSNQCTPRAGFGQEIVIPSSPGLNT